MDSFLIGEKKFSKTYKIKILHMSKKCMIFVVLYIYTLVTYSQNNKDCKEKISNIIHKEDVIINLKQKNSNLFWNTHIESDSIKLMLESGTSGLILDEMFYDNFKDKSLFNLSKSFFR